MGTEQVSAGTTRGLWVSEGSCGSGRGLWPGRGQLSPLVGGCGAGGTAPGGGRQWGSTGTAWGHAERQEGAVPPRGVHRAAGAVPKLGSRAGVSTRTPGARLG